MDYQLVASFVHFFFNTLEKPNQKLIVKDAKVYCILREDILNIEQKSGAIFGLLFQSLLDLL